MFAGVAVQRAAALEEALTAERVALAALTAGQAALEKGARDTRKLAKTAAAEAAKRLRLLEGEAEEAAALAASVGAELHETSVAREKAERRAAALAEASAEQAGKAVEFEAKFGVAERKRVAAEQQAAEAAARAAAEARQRAAAERAQQEAQAALAEVEAAEAARVAGQVSVECQAAIVPETADAGDQVRTTYLLTYLLTY